MKHLLTIVLLVTSMLSFSQNNNKATGETFIKLLLQEKKYQEAYSYFDETIKSKISIKLLQDTELQLRSQLGEFKAIIEVNNENNTFFYYSDFEKMKLDVKITFNDNSKIIGFFFTPHKEFKKADSLGKDLNIISGNIDLKGTMLMPENDNLKKLVLFVHGSGPQDRDETIYENKPFKDIAEGLNSKGIASYRFDKGTLTNPDSFNDKSTIDDEVTNDIISIINYLKEDKQFKDYEIIVLGHSLGANLLARIANQTNKISKIILLAGNARPLEVLIAEQYDYLYKLDPSQELLEAVNKVKGQIAFLKSKDFNVNSSKDKLPLNLSGYYWQSLLDYSPLKEIKKIKMPILILQGERDYQVTMKDFELWKSTLKNNNKATFISYPKLNHLFMSGEGISEPKEYLIKGNVDAAVIDDISSFVKKQ
jgi:pimeloyl-ACP methyl ester carboxylesterase